MDLYCKLSRDGVLPNHWQDLDLRLVDWGQLRFRQFFVIGVQAKSI